MKRPVETWARTRRAPSRLARVGALGAVLAWGMLLTAPVFAATDEDAASGAAKADLDALGVYAMSTARTESGIHIVEYWSKGAVLRAHATIKGHPLWTLVTEDTYYTLDPVFRRGVAIPRSPRSIEANRGRRRLFANEYEDMLAAGAEMIRSEDTPSGPVEVYRVTDGGGRRTVWVTSDAYRLPLKFETYSRATGQIGRLDYVNWSPLKLSDEFFEPPTDGWEITKVPTYQAWLRGKPGDDFRQAPIIFPLLLHGRP